jgi:thiol-disulfide isomerase/thioredoxin
MKQHIHAIATALASFYRIKDEGIRIKDALKSKDEGSRMKDFGVFWYLREKVFTRRPLPAESGLKHGQAGFECLRVTPDARDKITRGDDVGKGAVKVKGHAFSRAITQGKEFNGGKSSILTNRTCSTNPPFTHHPRPEKIFLPAGQAGGWHRQILRRTFDRKCSSRRILVAFGRQKELVLAAQEAGKAVGKGHKQDGEGLNNGMFHFVQHDGVARVMRYLRQWGLTRGFLPLVVQARPWQAMTAKGRGSAFTSLRPSIISFLLTLVIIYSSAGNAKSQELKIGDTIPQEVWDMPLQVVNHPEGKTSITLNEYKGKLLILDFWATSCGSCIAKMPEIVDLNKEYKDQAIILPVSYQPGEKVVRFMEINPVMKPLQLFTVVNDTLLKKYFPHYYLPHEVWIDGNGKVLAFTESEYLDTKNIAKAITSQQNLVRDKKEDQYLDKNKALFAGITGYYSKVGPHRKGFRYTSGVSMDSLEATKRYYVINASLLQLYALALQSDGLPLNPKRRILEVKDPSGYVYQKDWGYQQEWRQQYTWSYEAVSPIVQSITERKAHLLETLNSYFNCTGRIAKREVPCLVLRPLKHKRAAKPLPGSACISIANLLHRLNQDPAWPVLIDESGRRKEEELLLPAGNPDLETLNTVLAIQGLQLVKEQRKLDVFILTENSFTSSASE